jgi:choline kinase
MQHIKQAIILAAGMGSRLGMDIPKCMVEIHGKKIIDYQMELLQGFDDIRLVVGFKEEKVLEYISKNYPNVICVRNPNYATTSNICSADLATRHLKGSCIFLDGDVLIERNSFADFLKVCWSNDEDIIGITEAVTEEPVYAHLENDEVIKFSQSDRSSYEWCGVAYFKNMKFDSVKFGYIYRVLEVSLPTKYHILEAYEIDTPQDFAHANKMMKY